MRSSRLPSALITVLLWAYWIGAFAAGYWLVVVVAGIVGRQRGFSWALGKYAGIFFRVAQLFLRNLRIEVPERAQLRQISGSVVVCNHLSFLDPLLLLWLLPGVSTIVRPSFFRVPVFGWLLRGAGFLGPHLFAEGQPWLDRVAQHLRSGGNLLIFPEGTRSRDGKLAPFRKGAFYLAKQLSVPILVLKVAGTDRVLPAGQWTLNLAPTRPIEIRPLACIGTAEAAEATTHELTLRVYRLLADTPTGTRPSC